MSGTDAEDAKDEARNKKRKEVVQNFVRALGGGCGKFDRLDDSNVFVMTEDPRFPDNLFEESNKNFGLSFGRIRFEANGQLVPYVRIPWKEKDEHNELRAQELCLFFRHG